MSLTVEDQGCEEHGMPRKHAECSSCKGSVTLKCDCLKRPETVHPRHKGEQQKKSDEEEQTTGQAKLDLKGWLPIPISPNREETGHR